MRSSRNEPVKANQLLTVLFQQQLLLLVKKQLLKNQNIAFQVILPLHHLSSKMGKTNTQESIWT